MNQIASKVEDNKIQSLEIQKIIDAMFEKANGEQGDIKRRTMVGLAAPQIGVDKRILLAGINSVGLGEQPILKEFINPEIIYKSKISEDGREGCYSTNQICGIVNRSKTIKVKALDRNGKLFEQKFEGFPARILQHEIDHLNGIRFPDLITDDSKLHWVVPSKFGNYRKNWKTWKIICPRDKWLKIKNA